MIEIQIPGRNNVLIKNVVFDYNGTIAVDGVIPQDIRNELITLSRILNIYVLTADTYGNVRTQCKELPVSVETFENGNVSICKMEFVMKIGNANTLAVGNGINDVEMFKQSALSVAVLGEEGCATKTLFNADIVVKSIKDVFQMLYKTERIKATLRD
jgi:soluble P-type ATPase